MEEKCYRANDLEILLFHFQDMWQKRKLFEEEILAGYQKTKQKKKNSPQLAITFFLSEIYNQEYVGFDLYFTFLYIHTRPCILEILE